MGTVAILPAPSSPQAVRTLMVLGLLQSGPRHGYDIHRIMVAHGSLYADFKKPTLYHLLARLAEQGAVKMQAEAGARGPRGERLVYAITAAGRALFNQLLRAMLGSYDTNHAGFQVAAGFVSWMPEAEAVALLEKRRAAIRERRAEVVAEMDHLEEPVDEPTEKARRVSRALAADHSLCLMDAELAWIDRALGRIAGNTGQRRKKSWKNAGSSR
jgi:DNA-binding PadR family transcriptional regulator